MKLWETEHIFRHAWEIVTEAVWRKYPNDLNPMVKAIDILDREVDKEGNLRTVRLIGTVPILPAWATYILGLEEMTYALEESVIDPFKKTMRVKTKNLTWSSIVSIEEFIVYKQHPDSESMTLLSQEAKVKVFGVSFKDYCENLITTTIEANAAKGRQAMEQVIAKINKEVQDLANELEQSKSKINEEFEHLKLEVKDIATGFEQAAKLPTVCDLAGSTPV